MRDIAIGDIAILYILPIWLENAYSRPFWVDVWAHFPQMMSLIVVTPKTRSWAEQRHLRHTA